MLAIPAALFLLALVLGAAALAPIAWRGAYVDTAAALRHARPLPHLDALPATHAALRAPSKSEEHSLASQKAPCPDTWQANSNSNNNAVATRDDVAGEENESGSAGTASADDAADDDAPPPKQGAGVEDPGKPESVHSTPEGDGTPAAF
eukprot:m51a1_g428 hypothetical protein (149) ;mRNA; f:31928-32537